MRLFFLAFLILASAAGFAQDTTSVSFAEEQDTLVRQRFVDRYENVFMTKVPSRHMFKVGLTFLPNYLISVENSSNDGTQLDLGYEYKVLPSWSVGADAGVSGNWGSNVGFGGMLSAKVYTRWYYDMRRRIREGTSVNNFTGNFLALVGERHWGKGAANNQLQRLGIEFGLQRRFFNLGRIELGVGLYYQDFKQRESPFLLAYHLNKSSQFAITSRTSMGIGFGDWKRQKNLPICEVLFCEDDVQQQWKLLWPKLYLSPNFVNGTVGAGYERKIAKSPFSLNTQVTAFYMRIASKGLSYPLNRVSVSNDFQVHSSIQMRYYLHQRQNIRLGKGGNNLSGPYIGPYADHLFYHSETIFGVGKSKKHVGLGVGFGQQQTIFNKAYVDLSVGVSHNLLKTDADSKRFLGAVKLGFGLIL
ncbi:hypothetical protein [Dyadobacter sp. Leaf189]|uniref:hypothetical protein n=1 Tax=Dyadobacter sp. Leaf189 TaxID=1736295 RepID=UPI0006F871E7|nr:hypothetical protein [Dyadobacter sp. Leaf189]KQS33941.1 hypothetical protein ASG33_07880 [Dyadobacter sp. Leaf189]